MLQIINISQARSNLSSIVKKVNQTKQSVIIMKDSSPLAMISPYIDEVHNRKKYLKKLLSIKGTWAVESDYKKIREEIEERLKKSSL